MELGVKPDFLLRKHCDGYSCSVSADKTLICLWKPGARIEIYRAGGGELNTKGTGKDGNKGLIGVCWQKHILYCYYSDGTVYIYNGGQELVRQVTLLPKGAKTRCIFCDIIQLDDDPYSLTEGNLLKRMPKLNKWDTVKNALDSELILPDQCQRQKTLELFLCVEAKTNKLFVSVDGTLNIKLGDKLKLPKDVTQVLSVTQGRYMCVNKQLDYQILDLTFLQDHNMYKLIKATQEYSTLLRYLKQLHRHLGMKLTEPYYQFIASLWSESQKNALQDLFYTGITDLDQIEQISEVSLQQFRLDKWRALSRDLCTTSTSLIVACMCPVLERMCVVAASIESLCEAITWMKFTSEANGSIGIRSLTVSMFRSLRQEIESLGDIRQSHRAGLDWVDLLAAKLLELAKTKDQLTFPAVSGNNSSTAPTTTSDATPSRISPVLPLLDRREIWLVEQFLISDMVPQPHYEYVKSEFPQQILKTQAQFDTTMKDCTMRWIKRQISAVLPSVGHISLPDPVLESHVIIFPSKQSHRLLLAVTELELVVIHLETKTIECRASLPLPSKRTARLLASSKPRLRLIPQPQTAASFFLLPLCLTVTITSVNEETIKSRDHVTYSIDFSSG